MDGIHFNAHYGDEIKKVEISQAGGGGDAWHVYIDNYYQGRIAYIRDEWVNLDRKFDTPDFEELVQRIVEHLNSKEKGPV